MAGPRGRRQRMRERRADIQSSAWRQRASACSRAVRGVVAGGRVRPEELHAALLGVQVARGRRPASSSAMWPSASITKQ